MVVGSRLQGTQLDGIIESDVMCTEPNIMRSYVTLITCRYRPRNHNGLLFM